MNIELAKKLKDAGFPQNTMRVISMNGKLYDHSQEIWIDGKATGIIDTEGSYVPTLEELIEAIMNQVNELAIGYNDSGSFWHFQYGERGSGNMIEGIGKRTSFPDGENLFEAVANLYLALHPHGNI